MFFKAGLRSPLSMPPRYVQCKYSSDERPWQQGINVFLGYPLSQAAAHQYDDTGYNGDQYHQAVPAKFEASYTEYRRVNIYHNASHLLLHNAQTKPSMAKGMFKSSFVCHNRQIGFSSLS
jgi:hypothetical protein